MLKTLFPMKVALLLWLLPHALFGGTPLQQLLDSNLVSASAKGLGGYQNLSARVFLKNHTNRKLEIVIENGRRLICSDTTMQNLLVVKDKHVVLEAFGSDSADITAFCCNMHRKAPARNVAFSINRIDSTSWLPLTNLLNRKTYNSTSIQNAVWALSDDQPLSGVFASDPADNQLLRQTVAGIKKIPIPWYYIEFLPPEMENQLASERPKRLWGEFEYVVNGNTMVSIVVKNNRNEIVKVLQKGLPNASGSHITSLELDVVGWQKGKYRIQVIADYSNVVAAIPFEL